MLPFSLQRGAKTRKICGPPFPIRVVSIINLVADLHGIGAFDHGCDKVRDHLNASAPVFAAVRSAG
jgi:hypothetical protein